MSSVDWLVGGLGRFGASLGWLCGVLGRFGASFTIGLGGVSFVMNCECRSMVHGVGEAKG